MRQSTLALISVVLFEVFPYSALVPLDLVELKLPIDCQCKIIEGILSNPLEFGTTFGIQILCNRDLIGKIVGRPLLFQQLVSLHFLCTFFGSFHPLGRSQFRGRLFGRCFFRCCL